jgi:hypothetical protein
MSDHDLLLNIQKLQFSAKSEAEALLLGFVQRVFPMLAVRGLSLRPQPTSLNSFNGFLELADGSSLFFKTHTEQDNAISEYYNAEMLEQAGYPVVKPLYSSTVSGQQLLIYPVITAPPVFDVARALEMNRASSVSLDALRHAQNNADHALLGLYERSLGWQTGEEAAKAPIHQLFYHRLTGGRLDRFYADAIEVVFPHQTTTWGTVKTLRWVINGVAYAETLGSLIDEAIRRLTPHQAGASVIGHGDAHNGNVFYEADGLRYFDPAFAGRHDPLLDIVKPIFHNVFAMWMYFREEERERLSMTAEVRNETWCVSHDYALNPVRQMFLASKLSLTLTPLLHLLNQRGWLPTDWRRRIKLALMCCPLLTMNLTTFPPEIALLGLSFAIEMGAESGTIRSTIDSALDDAAQQAGL